MKRIYYQKARKRNIKRNLRIAGLLISLSGIMIVVYIFAPLLSFQIMYAPIFDAQKLVSPLSHAVMAAQDGNPFITSANANVDYTNAQNWFPHYSGLKPTTKTKAPTLYYTMSIPKINIKNALVSAVDDDLSLHMINFAGTAVPPQNGTAVVFGHSTLPQLYDPTNYKTILANAHHLGIGDTIIITIGTAIYTYKIFSVTIIDPEDTSVFTQNYDNSYLTLVTCTPPGTILYRLVIKARLEKI